MRLLLILSALLAALAGGTGLYAYRQYELPGPLAQDAAIVIPRGGAENVAAALQQAGAIRAPWQFEIAMLATRRQGAIHAAELEFPAAASVREVLAILRAGKPIQHRLTIAEGLSAQQVAALLAHAPALEGEAPTLAEGSVLPETYLYERGATRAAIAARATQAMDRALAAAWAGRAPDLPLATPAEALTLASIVERETARADERPLVAGVYLNRLRRGMKLQSDPSVVYGASGGLGVLDHGLTRAELDADQPYNTYRNAGLPPGPICMPSASSLEAVTHPAQTGSLFFVADGSGGHAFARTKEEHLRNVVRWRATERERAAMRPLP